MYYISMTMHPSNPTCCPYLVTSCVYARSDTWPLSLRPRFLAIQIWLIPGTCHGQFKATIILPDTNSPERYAAVHLLASHFRLENSVYHLYIVLFIIMAVWIMSCYAFINIHLCVFFHVSCLFNWNILLAMMSQSLNLGVHDVSSCFKIICYIERVSRCKLWNGYVWLMFIYSD